LEEEISPARYEIGVVEEVMREKLEAMTEYAPSIREECEAQAAEIDGWWVYYSVPKIDEDDVAETQHVDISENDAEKISCELETLRSELSNAEKMSTEVEVTRSELDASQKLIASRDMQLCTFEKELIKCQDDPKGQGTDRDRYRPGLGPHCPRSYYSAKECA
jgi:hypothetical protein